MKTWTVVAYTYKAETLCLDCTYGATLADWDPWRGPESELDRLAEMLGIDREDEHTYDSDEFPKVVFADSVSDGEKCDHCGGEFL